MLPFEHQRKLSGRWQFWESCDVTSYGRAGGGLLRTDARSLAGSMRAKLATYKVEVDLDSHFGKLCMLTVITYCLG